MRDDVVRLICWYQKDPGDQLIGEARIDEISLSVLQSIFGVPENDPMYYCYRVGPDHARALQPYVKVQLDLARYDYFVECEASRRPTTGG